MAMTLSSTSAYVSMAATIPDATNKTTNAVAKTFIAYATRVS
jgi:hypothetical protein